MPDMIDLMNLSTANADNPSPTSLVPKDAEFNNVFGTYTRHIFQNYTKIFQTDVNFFVMVPPSLLTYYYYILLPQLYWYRGYVPSIHNQGVISQQLGQWICDTVARLTSSGGFHIETEDDKIEDALTDMLRAHKVEHRLSKRLSMLNAGGFMLAYATKKYGTELNDFKTYSIKFVDCNRHFAKVNDEGEVLGFVAYIKSTTPDPDSGEMGYSLVLKRWIERLEWYEEDGTLTSHTYCLERYSIYKGPAIVTTPTFHSLRGTSAHECDPSQIPNDVMANLSTHLGDHVLNFTRITPFGLGCGASIIYNNLTATGIEDHENVSNGTLFNIVNQLYEYDLTKAHKMVNKNMAVTKVLLPDNFYSPPAPMKSTSNDPDRYVAQLMSYHQQFNDQMGHTIFKKVPYVSAKEQAPFFFQADNQSETYNKDIKFLLSEIAAKVHLSPATLAPFISEKAGLNQKTAEQVNSEENETRLTVSYKRELLSTGLEMVLEQIVHAATGEEYCDLNVIWNKEEIVDPIKQLKMIQLKLELRLISHERALKLVNRHLSKRNLTKLQGEIDADKQEEHRLAMELKAKAEPAKPSDPKS